MSCLIERPALTCTVCVVLRASKVDLNNDSANMVGMTSKTVLSAIFFFSLVEFCQVVKTFFGKDTTALSLTAMADVGA